MKLFLIALLIVGLTALSAGSAGNRYERYPIPVTGTGWVLEPKEDITTQELTALFMLHFQLKEYGADGFEEAVKEMKILRHFRKARRP